MNIDQMLGNLFFRGCSPTEAESMPYHRLKYWGAWCERMNEAERNETAKANSK